MSGSLLTLAETRGDAPRALPAGTDPASLHAALTAEITERLGPAHAALLARPVPSGSGLAWQAAGQDARRLADLPAESRRALLAAAGSILSDLRRLVEGGKAPVLATVWPGLRLVPGLASVFAVDGRPVLTAWAHPPPPGGDPLAAYDDGVRHVAPPRPRWQPWAASLGAVAALAALAILLLPQLARWMIAEPALCRVEPAQLALMRQQADAEARGNALRGVLAATNDEIGRRQLMCALPVVQAPPPPPPPPPPVPRPAPPAPPPARAELPSDQWRQHDLSMLEGCWHSSTQMLTRDAATGVVRSVAEWRICFNRGGVGRQTIRWSDGMVCTGPETATFGEDDTLLLTDARHCGGPGRSLFLGRFVCNRVNDTEANCTRTDVDGPARGQSQTGRFSR